MNYLDYLQLGCLVWAVIGCLGLFQLVCVLDELDIEKDLSPLKTFVVITLLGGPIFLITLSVFLVVCTIFSELSSRMRPFERLAKWIHYKN